MTPENNEPQKVYPLQTEDGFYFEDDTDEVMGIETKKYENGKVIKKFALSDGRIAIIRELAAWEMEESGKYHEGNKDLYQIALATYAAKIDDKPAIFDEIKFMRAKDWNKIRIANAINFM